MARPHYIYVRVYLDILDDPKVGLLPDSVKWRFISCLVLAGEVNEEGFLPDMPTAAFRLRTTEETLRSELQMLAQRGLVELRLHPDGEERWFVTNFAKRQAPLSSTERSRKHRAKKEKLSTIYSEPVDKNSDVSHTTTTTDLNQSNTNNNKVVVVKGSNENATKMQRSVASTRAILAEWGIDWNQKTAQLDGRAYMTSDYVARHVMAVRAAGQKPGLAITRMLAGEAAPNVCPKCGSPLKIQTDPYTGRISGFCSKSFSCDYRFSEGEEEELDYQYEENSYYG